MLKVLKFCNTLLLIISDVWSTWIFCGWGRGGCRVKNAYELLNLRALKFSPMNKIHIFQCMGKIFYVEFQRAPHIEKCNFYTTLKFKELSYLRARKHFWNAPQVPIKCICNCHDVDTGCSAHLRRDPHNVSVKVSSTRSRSHASTLSILVPISKHLPLLVFLVFPDVKIWHRFSGLSQECVSCP